MSKPLITRQNIKTPVGRFWFLSGMLANLIRTMNVGIHSDPLKVFESFKKLSPDTQTAYLHKVSLCVGLMEGAIEDGLPIVADEKFIWYTLKKLKLTPPSDLFNSIEHSDYVEIFDSKGVRIFTNFELCAQTSYCFEETMMFSCNELYKKDPKYDLSWQKAFQDCFSAAEGPSIPYVEAHLVEEIFSSQKKKAMVKAKVFSPLRGQSGDVEAMLCSLSVTPVN